MPTILNKHDNGSGLPHPMSVEGCNDDFVHIKGTYSDPHGDTDNSDDDFEKVQFDSTESGDESSVSLNGDADDEADNESDVSGKAGGLTLLERHDTDNSSQYSCDSLMAVGGADASLDESAEDDSSLDIHDNTLPIQSNGVDNSADTHDVIIKKTLASIEAIKIESSNLARKLAAIHVREERLRIKYSDAQVQRKEFQQSMRDAQDKLALFVAGVRSEFNFPQLLTESPHDGASSSSHDDLIAIIAHMHKETQARMQHLNSQLMAMKNNERAMQEKLDVFSNLLSRCKARANDAEARAVKVEATKERIELQLQVPRTQLPADTHASWSTASAHLPTIDEARKSGIQFAVNPVDLSLRRENERLHKKCSDLTLAIKRLMEEANARKKREERLDAQEKGHSDTETDGLIRRVNKLQATIKRLEKHNTTLQLEALSNQVRTTKSKKSRGNAGSAKSESRAPLVSAGFFQRQDRSRVSGISPDSGISPARLHLHV